MAKLRRVLALTTLLALAPAVQAKDKKPVDPNKRICRRDDSTGSIMPKSTCHTAAEWAKIDGTMRDSGPATGDMRGQGGVRPGGFSGN